MQKKKLTIGQQLAAAGFNEQSTHGTDAAALYVHESAPVRIRVEHDGDTENPIESWDTQLVYVDFGHYCEDVEAAVREHMGCPEKYTDHLFFAADTDSRTAVYLFDGFKDPKAGFLGKDGRRLWKKAAQYTECFRKNVWLPYLDGEVYYFNIEVLGESVDGCGGFYGFDNCLEDALEVAKAAVKDNCLPDRLKIETPEDSVLLKSEADFANWCAIKGDEAYGCECQGEPIKYPCIAWVHLVDDNAAQFHPVFLYPILRK